MMVRLVVPPVVALCLVLGYLGADALGFRPFAPPEADSVSEAAALGHAARALAFVADGQDVNSRSHIRPGILDGDSHDLYPIEAAILGRHAEMVSLLRRSGATSPDEPRIACLERARLPEEDGDVLDVAAALASCATAS
jgi:hypothetical protein